MVRYEITLWWSEDDEVSLDALEKTRSQSVVVGAVVGDAGELQPLVAKHTLTTTGMAAFR